MKRFALTLCTFFLLIGCESPQSAVTDTETSTEVSIYNQTVSSDLHAIHYLSDNMDRGNHEYFDSTLIVEPRINENELNRGTIVFVDEEISRIIGLPNESVKIDNGKVLIDGVQLDTFYGKAHRLGMSNKEDYLSFLKDNNAETHNRSESVFNYSRDETNLGEYEYFLMSDDWLRGNIKEINYNQIDGIVLGILE